MAFVFSRNIPTGSSATVFLESFELSENWNGTYDLNTIHVPSPTFSIVDISDSFEFSEDWPGTNQFIFA